MIPAGGAREPRFFSEAMLDGFLYEVDRAGGFAHPAAAAIMQDFRYRPTTKVDTSLDPFGAEYLDQQLQLYREISGRDLDQNTGELFPEDLSSRIDSSNPHGSRDLNAVTRHAITVMTALRAANPPPRARVLDLGAGTGMSSEIFAFCGAEVTAVDINPEKVRIINSRAARRGLPMTAVEGNFDRIDVAGPFDIVFFYESLHHAVRPWEVISQAAGKLADTGRLVFAGEPIQATWWPHWGLRLGGFAVYCIRKYGWFENGFSEPFLTRCFERAGLDLIRLHQASSHGGVIGIGQKRGVAQKRIIQVPDGAVRLPKPAAPVRP